MSPTLHANLWPWLSSLLHGLRQTVAKQTWKICMKRIKYEYTYNTRSFKISSYYSTTPLHLVYRFRLFYSLRFVDTYADSHTISLSAGGQLFNFFFFNHSLSLSFIRLPWPRKLEHQSVRFTIFRIFVIVTASHTFFFSLEYTSCHIRLCNKPPWPVFVSPRFYFWNILPDR